jgi:hypothetical protein
MGRFDGEQPRGIGPIWQDGDPLQVEAIEGERRRSIEYRGKLEGILFVIGAGMGLVIAGAILVAVVRAVL